MASTLAQVVANRCLEFGDFTLKSGRRSSYYLDVRKLSLSGFVGVVIDELTEVLEPMEFDAVGGPCVGADPLVGAYLYASRRYVRGFLVRKDEKGHGKAGLVIGSVRPGDRCVLVEDVVTTGGSLLAAADALEDFGCTVVGAVVVVDRLEGAGEALAARGIPLRALTTIDEVLGKTRSGR